MTEVITGRGRVTVSPFQGDVWMAYTAKAENAIVATMSEFDLWGTVEKWVPGKVTSESVAYHIYRYGRGSQIVAHPEAVTFREVDWSLAVTHSHEFTSLSDFSPAGLRVGVLEIDEGSDSGPPLAYSSENIKTPCTCGLNKDQATVNRKQGYSMHGVANNTCALHLVARFHGEGL